MNRIIVEKRGEKADCKRKKV